MRLRESALAMAVALIVTPTFGAGCSMEIPQEARPDAVRAIWNPATSVLPTPTNLVRDDALGRLDLPVESDMSAAEVEFRGYLNTLDGYPLSTALAVPLDGPINRQTLPGTLLVTDMSTGTNVWVSTTFDTESNVIRASATGGDDSSFLGGRSYAFGLWGYEGGVRGLDHEPVIADAAFYMVRSTSPLSGHATAMPGHTYPERQETADSLEEVQVSFDPLFALMAQRGIARDQVAVLSSFTTTTRPAIWFDPASSRIPMPNDILINPDTGLVDLPVRASDDEERRDLIEGLSRYRGFSTSGAIIVRSTHDFGAAALANEFRLFGQEPDGSWLEVHDLERGILDSGDGIWIKPRLTLEPETHYVYVIARDARSRDGRAHEAQPLSALLRSKAPLLANDMSQVGTLSHEAARRLEPLRASMSSMLDQLEGQGVLRSELSAAVPFQTTATATTLMDMRARLYTENVRTDIVNVDSEEPSGGLRLFMPNVARIVRGELTILDHLSPDRRGIVPEHPPQDRLVKFVMTLPRDTPPDKAVPVVLFGHGLMTSRELVYMIGDKLARAGFASISIDLPMHGDRSVCLQDSNCRGNATCDPVGQCMYPDGSKGELESLQVGYMVPFLAGTQYADILNYPVTSGAAFVDFHSLFASRDHFIQALLDLCQTLRVIRGPELSDFTQRHAGITLNSDDVVYLGMSLGGILGAGLSAIEPTLTDFVLNVPGADVVTIIEESTAFERELENALRDKDIVFGSDDYLAFTNGARWVFDPVDPLNLVQHTILDPLVYTDPVDGLEKTSPAKRVLIQMAEGDLVVPNASTRILSERMGVPITMYPSSLANHAFLFDPNPLATSSRNARNDMVEFFDAR